MVNPLSGLLSSLFGGGSSESVLGIDIGSSSIKLVQLKKRKGTPVLETYGEIALGPYSDLEVGRATNLPPERLAAALSDLLKEANVTSRAAGVAVPYKSSLVTLLELPDVGRKQLESMVPLEARKYIPVPIGEVTLDWFIVPEEESKYLARGGEEEKPEPSKRKTVDVLLVAIHNDTLSTYQAVMESANMNVSFYEIEIFSTIRATLGQGIAPVMVLDIGAAASKAYIVEFGIVRASHIINRGGQDITISLSKSLGMSIERAEREKRERGIGEAQSPEVREPMLLTLEHIFAEANRVLLSYQRKYNKNVEKVILTGGGAVLRDLSSHAQSRFETEVELADPFSKVETPAFLGDLLREVGPEFAVAVGAALRKLQEVG